MAPPQGFFILPDNCPALKKGVACDTQVTATTKQRAGLCLGHQPLALDAASPPFYAFHRYFVISENQALSDTE